jgi:glycosyltransferase involved in cell wall biosynthesis
MLVSIYIPTKNRLELLKRAIRSVKGQTYKNIELIVVDDASTDGTREYLKREMKLGNLKAIFHNQSLGACAARNAAILCAQGEYVTGLDDDDYFEIKRIEEFINKLNILESAGETFSALYTNVKIIKLDSKIKNISYPVKSDLTNLKKLNTIGNQIFIQKSRLINVGGFDVQMNAWQDYECWFRIVEKYGQMFNVGSSSYVMDTSHQHVRISDSGIKKIQAAHDLFLLKHKIHFDEYSKNKFKLNLYRYEQHTISLRNIIEVVRSGLLINLIEIKLRGLIKLMMRATKCK